MRARGTPFILAAAMSALASAAAGQALSTQGQDPLAGARVFGQKGCAGCHAVNGQGRGTTGPDLARVGRPRSFHDLSAALWNHLPAMASAMRKQATPRPELNATEAANLIAFLYTIDYFDRPGDRARGQRFFTAKQCVACHQREGVGGVVGPNLDYLRGVAAPIDLATAMWNHGPAMVGVMTARRVPRPTFTGQELRDLVAFLAAPREGLAEGPVYVLPGRAAAGERLFAEKRCVTCHAQPGKGGGLAPDLAARAERASLTDFAVAMWNKAPSMTAEMRARGIDIPALTSDQMADIVAYLYSIRYFGSETNEARGRQVAEAKGCQTCHRSGRARPLFAGRALESPAPGAAPHLYHRHIAERSWPRFTPQEMADLTAALQRGGAR
jgi:mono/diheme cytochrome c family protein